MPFNFEVEMNGHAARIDVDDQSKLASGILRYRLVIDGDVRLTAEYRIPDGRTSWGHDDVASIRKEALDEYKIRCDALASHGY